MSIIIWVDQEIYNEDNFGYVRELESLGYKKIRLFEKINDAFDYIMKIRFENTKIIVNGRLFSEFINIFKANIKNICVVPKILIFSKNKKIFIENNFDYNNFENKFYTFGGIATIIEEIKEFLNKENKDFIKNDSFCISQINFLNKEDELKEIENNLDVQLTFEYIDKIEKLFLPMFFQTLIDKISNENIDEYTKTLYNKYSKESECIKKLLEQIIIMKNIPLEILCKYYARLYTFNSNFQTDLNKDLRLNKKDKYLPYIKTFYEGVKLKSLPLANNNILYRGGTLSSDEINKIKTYLKNKIEDLPGSIAFSKSFLSFSKDEKEAKKFLRNTNVKLSKVLYILLNYDNQGYNLSTHGDIEKVSYYPKEREVLYFPFSSFEIKDIQEIKIENEKIYQINLLYLGKYLKKIENDKNIIINEHEIPNNEFKKQLSESGLIEEKKLEKINTKIIFNTFKNYEKEINENNINIKNNNNLENNKNNKNIIIGEITIKPDDINKKISIINSFENIKEKSKEENKKDDWKYENEKEIKENIQIKINGKPIIFSYYYKFEKEGTYNIEYSFKNNLTKTNHIFFDCELITNLNLSNFNTENVTNMNSMFSRCKSLTNLDLSNFNTKNVTNMSFMFSSCGSLTNLEISNFDTQNVTNMKGMFDCCESLTYLDLSNFKTENVIDMGGIFRCCFLLKNLNLSNFNTKNVTDMGGMFYHCVFLKDLDLSKFDTKNVTDMTGMFFGCSSLTNLDISNFNTQNVTNMNYMFNGCDSLEKMNIICNDKKILKEFDKK